MIRHVFAWKVAPGYDPAKVVQILNTLPEHLDLIRGWEIGQHTGDPGDNGAPFDGVLVSDFASWEDLDAYSNDPYHLDVVAELTPMFSERAVVDFERGDQ